MKKSTKAMALLFSALFACGSLAACGGTNGGGLGGGNTKVDENTIVVKVRKAGFGTDWLYKLKNEFEAAYATEGYKVKILTPDNSIKDDAVVKELALGYNKVGVDLYITSGVTPEQAGVNGDYGVLVEDIAETVYNQKAIAYNGTEEEKTVLEKVSGDVLPYMTDSTGKQYAYCWAQTSGGLVVNTVKLAKYGLEIPRTTNEMFDCFEQIYCGNDKVKNSIISGTYPITYISGGNGYGVTFLYALLAQYSKDYFDQLWSFQTTDETGAVVKMPDEECQNLYNHEAIREMLNIAYRTFDANIASPGSLSQTVDQAQAKIMDDIYDGAVFMFNGDWMLNEVKLNYEDKLHDIDFVNFPVMSAIGTKLFGENTAYKFSEAKCDEILSFLVDCVDKNMTIEEMIAAAKTEKNVDLNAAEVEEVARARGVTYSRGMEHVAYITKGTPKKNIASLFLRMMSSDDFGSTFNTVANGSTPYSAQENTTSEYKFVRNASKLTANKYFSFVSLFGGARGYRKQLNFHSFFTTQSHIPDYISSKSTATIYTEDGKKKADVTAAVYAEAAGKLQKAEVESITKNWSKWLEAAGLK